MSAQRLDVSAVVTAAVSELVTAAREYLTVSRPLSEECEAAQTRLEQALSQFGGPDPYVQAEEIRGMAGRIRELETDLETLSTEMEGYCSRFERINDLLRATGAFAVGEGPDPIDRQVKEALAAMQPKSKRKGGRA